MRMLGSPRSAKRPAKKNEEKAKAFGNSASKAYATLIGKVQEKLKDKPAFQDLKQQILEPAIEGLQAPDCPHG